MTVDSGKVAMAMLARYMLERVLMYVDGFKASITQSLYLQDQCSDSSHSFCRIIFMILLWIRDIDTVTLTVRVAQVLPEF